MSSLQTELNWRIDHYLPWGLLLAPSCPGSNPKTLLLGPGGKFS